MPVLLQVKKIQVKNPSSEERDKPQPMHTQHLAALTLMNLSNSSPSSETPVSMKKMVPTTMKLKLVTASPSLSLVILMVTNRERSPSLTP